MTLVYGVLLTMLLGIPALLLHEMGHIMAALMCGVKVKRIGLSRVGLYTVREPGPKWANICVSFAGPLFNLLLAIMLRDLAPTFAWVNLMACAYNLLPIPHSDGRRILMLLVAERLVVAPEMPPARLRDRII
jgi:stage IV sporulation protein FB